MAPTTLHRALAAPDLQSHWPRCRPGVVPVSSRRCRAADFLLSSCGHPVDTAHSWLLHRALAAPDLQSYKECHGSHRRHTRTTSPAPCGTLSRTGWGLVTLCVAIRAGCRGSVAGSSCSATTATSATATRAGSRRTPPPPLCRRVAALTPSMSKRPPCRDQPGHGFCDTPDMPCPVC